MYPDIWINPDFEDYMQQTGTDIDEAMLELGLQWDEVWDGIKENIDPS